MGSISMKCKKLANINNNHHISNPRYAELFKKEKINKVSNKLIS